MSFRYPDHPNTNRTDPFRDEQGRNPFADPEDATPDTGANPYAATDRAGEGCYRPGGYERTVPYRAWLLIPALSGCVMAILGAAGVVAAFITDAGGGLQLHAAALLFGAAASVSAWLLARNDLAALRAGAMRTREGTNPRVAMRWAYWTGVAGSVIALLPLILLVIWLVQAIRSQW